MDDGYDFGEAVREAMRQGYKKVVSKQKYTISNKKSILLGINLKELLKD